MEDWRKDARHEPIIVDLEAMVPKGHLLRKIEKIMDFERLNLHYCYDNGRPGTDPVVFIKSGAHSASVWDTVFVADLPGNSGE